MRTDTALEVRQLAAALNRAKPALRCEGASKLAHFHEKVGRVKAQGQEFLKQPALAGSPFLRQRAQCFAFVIPRPSTSLLSRFFRAAKKSPNWPWDFFAAQ